MLLAAGLQAQPGGVTGVTVDQTGKPLAKVHVRLIAGDILSPNGVDAVYGVDSDASGQFSVDGIKAGLFYVTASRAGYIQTPDSPSGRDTLVIKAGQHVSDFKVVLAARALIVGRVVDEYGDPVQAVSVQTEPVPPDKPSISRPGYWSMTDDRGEFRMVTAPGKYYVKTTDRGRMGLPVEIRTDGTSGAPFVATYYPSATNASGASVVQAAAGQDVAGIEIRMLRAGTAAAHTFTVSGVVTGVPDNGRAAVMVRFGESAGQLSGSQFATTGADGKFSLMGLQPGFYSAAAFYSSGKTVLVSRPVRFQLEAADETGLQLMLQPGEDVSGKLEIVGDAAAGSREKLTIRLESVDRANSFGQTEPPAVEVGPDGSFRIANVLPGKFRPVVEPMPENSYLKEVALDGKTAADDSLDFSQGAGGSELKITMSRAGGRISGRILDKDGEPALGSMTVVIAVDPKHIDDNGVDRVSDARYSFKALRPGKYRLFAIDAMAMMQVFSTANNDETMQRLFDAGEEIEIKENDNISKDIPGWTELPEKKEAHAPQR